MSLLPVKTPQENKILDNFVKIEHRDDSAQTFTLRRLSNTDISRVIRYLQRYRKTKKRIKYIRARYPLFPKGHANRARWREEYRQGSRYMILCHVRCIEYLIQSK